MNSEPSNAARESATLDELEADVDLVDAAMTHVAQGNLDAAEAAATALSRSATQGVDAQDEPAESAADQPLRPAS